MAEYKKRWGDRPDARLLRDVDGLHLVMPLIYPNRADNEAFISETVDLTNMMAYIDTKNAENPEFTYKVFQMIVASVMKCVVLRPRLNYFICNKNMYERDKISCGFVIKKEFKDGAKEGLAYLEIDGNSTLETVRSDMYSQIHRVRIEEAEEAGGKSGRKSESTDDFMDFFTRIPRCLTKLCFAVFRFLDRHGWIPLKLISSDPDYATVFFSNLGSIGMHSGYHHLSNWGTTSMFVVVGKIMERPFKDKDGNEQMRMSVDVGITIDERIADGYYYSQTIKTIIKLIENPELLEKAFDTEVQI